MRILFVSEYWTPFGQGGGEISMELLARSLVEKGVMIDVLTSSFEGTPKEENKEGIKIYRRIRTGKNPRSFLSNLKRTLIFPLSVKKEVKELCWYNHYDIIHYLNTNSSLGLTSIEGARAFCHVNSPVFFCPKGTLMYKDREECHYHCTPRRFLRCFLRSKEFGKMQNKWYLRYNPVVQFLLYHSFKQRQAALKKFDHYTPVSEFMRNRLLENGISQDKITVVPNIMNLPTVKYKEPKNKVPRILYLGGYLDSKGIMVLLEALKEIKIPYLATFHGEGNLKDKMLSFVKENKLEEKVKIHSKIPYSEALRLIAQQDIIVQPSLVAEAIPRTVIDSIGLKKIVIGTSVGGTTDIIVDGKNGFFVKPGSVEELKAKLEYVLENRKQVQKKLNFRTNLEKYTQESVVKKILETYYNKPQKNKN